ncbi:MAG: hypothetical protein IKD69_04430 [Solobacterium sp.]|nr:hypothetical protein [Solobacterium sp.]
MAGLDEGLSRAGGKEIMCLEKREYGKNAEDQKQEENALEHHNVSCTVIMHGLLSFSALCFPADSGQMETDHG